MSVGMKMLDQDKTTEQLIDEVQEFRRQAAELPLLKFLIKHSSEAVFCVSPDLRFTYVNDAASSLLGYEPEELLALSVGDVDESLSRERWVELLKDVRRRGPVTLASQHRKKDGRPVPVEVRVTCLQLHGAE